jgi:hypothetical protein
MQMPEDTAVLDALAAITAVSIAGSELPAREHVARLAALVAVNAPPVLVPAECGVGGRGGDHGAGRAGHPDRRRPGGRHSPGDGRGGKYRHGVGLAVALAEAELDADA